MISVGVSVALVLLCDMLLFVTALRYLLVCYCIEISVGGSVALVLECDILLFVTALRYLLVCL
jgi:hypothetical protein